MVAVFAASSLSVVGASAVAGVEPAKAIIIAGIGGVAVVIEGLARAFLRDGSSVGVGVGSAVAVGSSDGVAVGVGTIPA